MNISRMWTSLRVAARQLRPQEPDSIIKWQHVKYTQKVRCAQHNITTSINSPILHFPGHNLHAIMIYTNYKLCSCFTQAPCQPAVAPCQHPRVNLKGWSRTSIVIVTAGRRQCLGAAYQSSSRLLQWSNIGKKSHQIKLVKRSICTVKFKVP